MDKSEKSGKSGKSGKSDKSGKSGHSHAEAVEVKKLAIIVNMHRTSSTFFRGEIAIRVNEVAPILIYINYLECIDNDVSSNSFKDATKMLHMTVTMKQRIVMHMIN